MCRRSGEAGPGPGARHVAALQAAQQLLVRELAGLEAFPQALHYRALAALARREADSGALAHRVHELARLLGRYPARPHQIPLEPLADRADELFHDLVG